MSTTSQPYDVTILGGGLAGLACALHCRKTSPDARIAILEKASHPVPEAAHKVGESTVEVATYYFTKVLELEEHILAEQLPKMGLRFFFGAGDNSKIEDRLEVGGSEFPPTPSYQLDRGRFENYLAQRCQTQGIDFLDGATVTRFDLGRGKAAHQVSYRRAANDVSLSTRWIVDASGRAAVMKRKLGLEMESPHKANAVWFRIKAQINVDDWSHDTRWRGNYQGDNSRWFSTNHLMGEGYWVWLIPLASGATSIGIVADDTIHPLATYNSAEKAFAWLEKYEPQCAEKVRQHAAELQDFRAIKQYATECKQVFSSRRWGIIGDAGYFLDPFYSPGSDFIAMGNTFLCELIRRDLLGKSNVLRAPLYNRLFRTFYRGTATVFRHQYPLFGNHQVMPVKILWDWMVYWTLTGHNFMHDRTCDPLIYARHIFKLKRLNDLNKAMQAFFRQWHQAVPSYEVNGTIDTSRIPLIVETNRGLQDELDPQAYAKRFSMNVAQMETLFWEIVDHAGISEPPAIKRPRGRGEQLGGFEMIFRESTQPRPAVDPTATPPATAKV